jgi:hypothetical protein
VNRAVEEGFIKAENRAIVTADSDPAALLDRLAQPLAAGEYPWIRTPAET